MDGLTVGRMVHYVLSEADAIQINRRRTDGGSIYNRIEAGTWPVGAQAHIGNEVRAGEHVAAVIVHVWGDAGMVNLKCLLDGSDDYRASSRSFCATPDEGQPTLPSGGTWHWIEKA